MLKKKHAPAFLAIAKMYDLQELKDLAEAEMLKQLTKNNMVQMISLGKFFRVDDIYLSSFEDDKG